jgi:hypothetical protein
MNHITVKSFKSMPNRILKPRMDFIMQSFFFDQTGRFGGQRRR